MGGRGGAGQRKTRGGLLTRTSSRVEDASRVTDRGGATPSRDDGSGKQGLGSGGGTRSRPERAAGTHRAAVRAAGGEVRVERRDASGRGAGHDSRACLVVTRGGLCVPDNNAPQGLRVGEETGSSSISGFRVLASRYAPPRDAPSGARRARERIRLRLKK